MSKKCKNPCSACPFEAAFSEAADRAQNLGCLPSAGDIVKAYREDNLTLSCHESDDLPCRGLVRYLAENKESLDLKKAPVYGHSVWYQMGLPPRPIEEDDFWL